MTCDCYECIGAEYMEDGITIRNNLLEHTLHEPCERCGEPKTEYRDLVRKGYYECWWCEHRAAEELDPRYDRRTR